MAAAIQKLHDHYLSCIICTDLYEDPCTLACDLTFCRACLATFTKTQKDAIKAKSIRCPKCRQMTKVTNPEGLIEDWVKEIRPSFLIQGLLDDFISEQGEHRGQDNQCFSCQQNDETTPASSHCIDCDISMCDKCGKVHRAMPISSHHEISGIAGEVKKVRKKKVRCKTHNNIIEFCCKDCSKAICQKCCILNHRKCEDVVTLESMVPEMKTTLKEYKDVLTQREQKIKSDVRQMQNRIKETEMKKVQVMSDITKVTQKAIHLIKQKERVLMDQAENVTEKRIEKLNGLVKAGEIDMQMYQQHCEFIDQVLTTANEMDMYEMMSVCQSGAIKADVGMSLADSTAIGEIMFVDELQQDMITRNLQLGSIVLMKEEIEVTAESDKEKSTSIDLTSTPTLVDNIIIMTHTDKKPFNPTDVAVLNINGADTLVVTDYGNRCLKSYIVSQRSYFGTLKLSNAPKIVMEINHNQVAVSFYACNQIVITKVTPDLVFVSCITTVKKYDCLTYLNNSTFVAGDSGGLDILDMTGRILKSLRLGMEMLSYPNFLCTTKNGNILVSDHVSESVYCLTPTGNVVFNYSPSGSRALVRPRGITMSKTGDILVADGNENKVVQLTPSGSFVRDILTSKDGIKQPYGICLHGHKLYLAQEQQLTVFSFNTGN